MIWKDRIVASIEKRDIENENWIDYELWKKEDCIFGLMVSMDI